MDPETMYDSVANVGVKDGKIAVITKKQIKGKETIDAKGLKEDALGYEVKTGIGKTGVVGIMRDGVSALEFFEVQKKEQDINNITPN